MKAKIHFITGNASKFEEARLIIGTRLVQRALSLVEPKTNDQREVVLEKARQAYNALKAPVMVDDTGIYFEAYKGFPGAATKLVFQGIGFKGIFKLLNGEKRGAHFKTLICYKDSKTTEVFEGVWHGRIITRPSRSHNPEWEYNSIFIPEGFTRPLSEIPLEVRARHSHRRKALDKFVRWLK